MMAEAIEQWKAQARRQRHGMSRLVIVAGLIALNVEQWDIRLMSAEQHYSALNLDPERGSGVSGGIQPKLNELHTRCKCHGEVTKK